MDGKSINLILQGGGIKGISYIGALRCFEQYGYKIKNVAGSSVGAIIGALIIAGYTSIELEQIIRNIDYELLIGKSNISEKIKKGGIHSNKKLELFIENLLLKKGIKYFSDIKVGNNYKAIFITTSLKHQRIFVLPYDLKLININPDYFSVSKAVMMSASIPFFYEKFKVNNYTFYDGGMSDNYPKWCFNTGFALKVSNENSFIKKIRQTIFGKIDKNNYIHEIFIDTKDYKSIDFKKGLNNINDLILRGYFSTYNYLNELLINN